MKLRYLLLTLIPFSAAADELEITTRGLCHWIDGTRMPCGEMWERFMATPYFWPIMLFYIALIVICIVAWWVIFQKAGKPGWASIVPIYNVVVQFQVAQMSPWYILALFVPIYNIVVFIRMVHRISRSFGHGAGFTVGLLLLGIIFLPILAFSGNTYRKLEN